MDDRETASRLPVGTARAEAKPTWTRPVLTELPVAATLVGPGNGSDGASATPAIS